MFTGIITHLGKFEKKEKDTYTFSAEAAFISGLKNGDSVAVNGVCLTIESHTDAFVVRLSPETLQRTTLNSLQPTQAVNLERPMLATSRFDGHIVQGHVDGVGTIQSITSDEQSFLLTVRFPQELGRYIVQKGSVTLNGISLTVAGLAENQLTVSIIPYTWAYTMLSHAQVGDLINIEVDCIAKYVEKLTQPYLPS